MYKICSWTPTVRWILWKTEQLNNFAATDDSPMLQAWWLLRLDFIFAQLIFARFICRPREWCVPWFWQRWRRDTISNRIPFGMFLDLTFPLRRTYNQARCACMYCYCSLRTRRSRSDWCEYQFECSHITYARTLNEGSGSSKSEDRSIILDPWPT